MADLNAGLGSVGFLRADFSRPRKKKRIGQCETVQETGDLPFGATCLAADNQSFLKSRQRRKKTPNIPFTSNGS